MNFEKEHAIRIEEIEDIIKGYMPKEEGFQKTIFEAMNYNLNSGGKRLRPNLMRETYRLFMGKEKVIEPFMAAIELIHTYSLVHDDLPAIDNDDYRRGRKTTHIIYGEGMAVLTGDALLNYGFEIATTAFGGTYKDVIIARALKVLASKAGVFGMIGGQVVDVESSGIGIDKSKLDFIYQLKTSALIEASMMIGAILGGADLSQVALIETIARDIGLAFQIQDDILDVTSSTEVLGKQVGSDEKNQKTTFVTLEGIDNAKQQVIELSNRAVNALMVISKENEYLIELITNLINREK